MLLLQIESTDALFQRKQWFIDLSPVHLCLLVCVHGISATLGARQIDEGHFAIFFTVVFQLHLKDGVWAGTVGVGTRLARGTALEAHADISHYVISLCDLFLSQAHNVHFLLRILSANNFLTLIEEIEKFPAVDFVKRQVKF